MVPENIKATRSVNITAQISDLAILARYMEENDIVISSLSGMMSNVLRSFASDILEASKLQRPNITESVEILNRSCMKSQPSREFRGRKNVMKKLGQEAMMQFDRDAGSMQDSVQGSMMHNLEQAHTTIPRLSHEELETIKINAGKIQAEKDAEIMKEYEAKQQAYSDSQEPEKVIDYAALTILELLTLGFASPGKHKQFNNLQYIGHITGPMQDIDEVHIRYFTTPGEVDNITYLDPDMSGETRQKLKAELAGVNYAPKDFAASHNFKEGKSIE